MIFLIFSLVNVGSVARSISLAQSQRRMMSGFCLMTKSTLSRPHVVDSPETPILITRYVIFVSGDRVSFNFFSSILGYESSNGTHKPAVSESQNATRVNVLRVVVSGGIIEVSWRSFERMRVNQTMVHTRIRVKNSIFFIETEYMS